MITEGTWKVAHYTNPDDNAIKANGRLIARNVTNDDDALITVTTAANACEKINPSNPLEVAESIEKMHDLLKVIEKKSIQLRELSGIHVMDNLQEDITKLLNKLEEQKDA